MCVVVWVHNCPLATCVLWCRAIYRRKSMAAGQLNLEQDTLRDMNNIIMHRGKKKDAGGDPARAKQ